MTSTPGGHDVDGLDGRLDLVPVAGQERFVDLQKGRTGGRQAVRLRVEDLGQCPHQIGVARVGVVAHPPGERERPGEGELDRPIGVGPREREVLGQPEGHTVEAVQRTGDRHVVVVVVVGLERVEHLDPRDAAEQVVDVVVPAQLAVGHHVDPGQLLVLQRGLDGHVADLAQVLPAQPVLVVVVLQPLQPLGHGVGADDRGRQERRSAVGPAPGASPSHLSPSPERSW